MKTVLTYLFAIILFSANAQTYPVTSITISLPANPDANTANWGIGTSQVTITANAKGINGRVDGFVQESKLLILIKKGGAKICGTYTNTTAPGANFNTLTKVWSGTNVVALIGQGCTLPPGDYELSVQFFGYSNGRINPLSEEKTKAFSIRGNEQQTYQAPQAIAPTNEFQFKESDIPKPLTFRWTPLIPRPQEPVTYRLRVWQLMQGQNGTQAMRVNQPIITKDVDNITQAIISNLLTGPCKPPYLCDFVWNVQALNREGKPVGLNNGTSESFSFSFSSTDKKPPMITLLSPTNGGRLAADEKPELKWQITVRPVNDAPTRYKIKIVEIKGDESPEQAFRGNKPIFEKDSGNWIHTNKPIFEKDSPTVLSFNYPLSAKLLKVGGKYAWNVQALNRDGKPIGGNGTSEVFKFIVDSAPQNRAGIKLVSPKNGGTINSNGVKAFTWLPPSPVPPTAMYKIKIVEIKGDQSPAQAFRGNKPIFEKDSGNWIHTNKPIFEKDTLMYLHSAKEPAFKPGIKYLWTVSFIDKSKKEQFSEFNVFTVKEQAAYHLIDAKYIGKTIEVADTAYLEFQLTDFPGAEQLDYHLINLSTQKTTTTNVIKVVKNQNLIQLALPLKSLLNPREQGVLTIGNPRKKYYISVKRN